MLSAEYKMKINDKFYTIEDMLSIFSIYQNPKEDIELVLVYREIDNFRYFLHVKDEDIEIIAQSENREWHNKIHRLGEIWKKINIDSAIYSSIRHKLFNYLSESTNREELMPDSKWVEEMEAKKAANA